MEVSHGKSCGCAREKKITRAVEAILDSRHKNHFFSVAWLGSTSHEEGSFRALCEVLNVSHADIRAKVSAVREGTRIRPRNKEEFEKVFFMQCARPERHLHLVAPAAR